jgi:hypothetical protein
MITKNPLDEEDSDSKSSRPFVRKRRRKVSECGRNGDGWCKVGLYKKTIRRFKEPIRMRFCPWEELHGIEPDYIQLISYPEYFRTHAACLESYI